MAQQRKARPSKAKRKPPAALFALSLVVLIGAMFVGGLRLQVGLKRRTRQGDKVYMEDTPDGTGSQFRVLVSSADTGGEYFTLEVRMRPTAASGYQGKPGAPPPHYHTLQDEILVVKSGSMGCFYNSKDNVSVARAGDTVFIPKGVHHTPWNADNSTDLVMEATLKPAGVGEKLLETFAGLGYDYGGPLAVSPLQAMLTFFRGHVVLTDMSMLQRAVVPFAELIGYKAFYPEYQSKHVPKQDS